MYNPIYYQLQVTVQSIKFKMETVAMAKDDLDIINSNKEMLWERNWFHGHITRDSSLDVLRNDLSIGNFLIHEGPCMLSHDPCNCCMVMEVSRGKMMEPVSIGIKFENGSFHIDAYYLQQHKYPLFDSMLELIEFYQEN